MRSLSPTYNCGPSTLLSAAVFVLTPEYIDEHLLVLNKPAGLLCVPGRGPDKQDCLSVRAQQQWPDALVVHRLDQGTSGLVVMARSLAVQRALGDGLEAGGGGGRRKSWRLRLPARGGNAPVLCW